jgi:hypothetical protein
MLEKLHLHLRGLSVFLILAALIAGMAGCGGDGYNPPSSQNLEIRTWYDLDAVRDNLAGNHTLMNDLNSTTSGYEELASPTANQGKGWDPIGFSAYLQFSGTFDGQGYEIRDLFINRPDWCWVGLFGFVGEGGSIEGVGVVNADVTGSLSGVWHGCDSAGILVGANLGTVNNSYSKGSIICEWNAGGLVGENRGTVSNSYYSGNVTSSVSGGGLVGWNDGIISNSYYNYDEVLINGENIITIGALFDNDFEEWLANDKFLNINERLSQEDGYYLINDINDLKQLLVFGQNVTLKFRLTDDLDLGDEPNFYIPYLAGEFDGNDYEISNFSFNSSFVYNVGLFGYLAPGSKIGGLSIENVNITAAWYVGGLVGVNCGTVSNCYATGTVTRSESSEEGYDNGAGGLVGRSKGTVSDSFFNGSVAGDDYVGGLVGDNDGTVSNSHSTGSVAGIWGVGGLVGSNYKGTVSNSYSSANVTGTCCHVGGLVGDSVHGTVSSSYSTGKVTGGDNVGGLIGNSSRGYVSNSYSSGNVTGDRSVGGLVGYNYEGTVSNSYSTGSATGNTHVGGLVGGGTWGDNVSNCFWDTETSGQSTSDGGTGKNTTEMQDITTFSGAGWDITAVTNLGTRNPSYIWNIVDDETYPFLSWEA